MPNVLAMFNAQTHRDKHLIILDDAGQLPLLEHRDVSIISNKERFATLGAKFDHLVSLAVQHDPKAGIALWDDDDVYFPEYLSKHSGVLSKGFVSFPKWKYTNHSVGRGKMILSDNCCHGSWGFLPSHYKDAGGYPIRTSEGFDTDLCYQLVKLKTADPWPEPERPQYVYRWGTASKNCSARGKDLMKASGALKPAISEIIPKLDDETEIYYKMFLGD